jgi:Nif-specific regulatory protein
VGNENEPGDLQGALQELATINRVIDRVCRASETNHIMSIIMNELIAFAKASQGVINLLHQEYDNILETVARDGHADNKSAPFRVPDLIAGHVLRHKQILKIDDLDRDSRFAGLSSQDGRSKAIICCPMIARGNVIGLTTLVRDGNCGPFDDNQCRVVGIIVSQSAQILSNALLLQELARKNELLEVSRRKLREENLRLTSEITAGFAFENIVGKSEPMRRVLTLAAKVCANDAALLITGPTGTGKELIARAVHYNSDRRNAPFVVKNCGVKTETLLESELFGHLKGAFTGADRNKPGLFKEADGGTIFLDEIADAPMSTQIAILRVLETGEIRAVGANKPEFVNVRIISATNRDLRQAMDNGTFREDLFYRLNTFIIDLPALCQRRDDIPLLVHHFLNRLKIKLGNDRLSITADAMEALNRYGWPGNVRQLENEMERAAVVAEGPIDLNHLSTEIVGALAQPVSTERYQGRLKEIVELVERDIITNTLAANKGNILRSANILGLTRKGLKDKIARYGLSEFRDE